MENIAGLFFIDEIFMLFTLKMYIHANRRNFSVRIKKFKLPFLQVQIIHYYDIFSPLSKKNNNILKFPI